MHLKFLHSLFLSLFFVSQNSGMQQEKMLTRLPVELQPNISSFLVEREIDYRLVVALHGVSTEEIQKLNLKQINLLYDLYAGTSPLPGEDPQKKISIKLQGERVEIFNSLPALIQKNLYTRYNIVRQPQIIQAHYKELLPAMYPIECRSAVLKAIADMQDLIAKKHICYEENPLPIVIFPFSYHAQLRRLEQNRCIYKEDAETNGLMPIDLSRPKQEQDQKIFKWYDQFKDNSQAQEQNPYCFMLVGLSNGQIVIYPNYKIMAPLEKLTVKQLNFIITMFHQAEPGTSEVRIHETKKELFELLESLPASIKSNLLKNYTITRVPKAAAPQQESRRQQLVRLYKNYRHHKLVYVTQLALSAGMLYCCLKWLSGHQSIQQPSILAKVLQHKKKFLLGSVLLMHALAKTT